MQKSIFSAGVSGTILRRVPIGAAMMRVSIGLPVAASGMQHTSNMIPRSMLIGFLSARHRSAGQPWHILGRCGGRSASTHRLILLWLKLVMSTLVLSTCLRVIKRRYGSWRISQVCGFLHASSESPEGASEREREG